MYENIFSPIWHGLLHVEVAGKEKADDGEDAISCQEGIKVHRPQHHRLTRMPMIEQLATRVPTRMPTRTPRTGMRNTRSTDRNTDRMRTRTRRRMTVKVGEERMFGKGCG